VSSDSDGITGYQPRYGPGNMAETPGNGVSMH
jgi:hypothetical protein